MNPPLQPCMLGDLAPRNRIVMAPLTHMGCSRPANFPFGLMREYYVQRATAGLFFSDETLVSDHARGWFDAPGIHTKQQCKGWRTIADPSGGRRPDVRSALASGVGYMSGTSWHGPATGGAFSHASGAIGPPRVGGLNDRNAREISLTDTQKSDTDRPHASVVTQEAGFDGVRILAGFTYLFQQFMQEKLNRRSHEYSGTVGNRTRLLFEVIKAVMQVWPSKRVGVKAGPTMNERGGFRTLPSTLATAAYVYQHRKDYQLSHVLLMHDSADLFRYHTGPLCTAVAQRPRRNDRLWPRIHRQAELVERSASLNPQHPEGICGATGNSYTDYSTLSTIESETK